MVDINLQSIRCACVLLVMFTTPSAWALSPTQVDKLIASDGAINNGFGYALATSDHTVIVGAKHDSDNGFGSGAVYVLIRDSSGNWVMQGKLVASDGGPNDKFGHSVAISGDTVVVGAVDDSNVARRAGSAYVFTRNATNNWIEQARLVANDGAVEDQFGFSVAVSGDTIYIGAPFDDDNGTNSGSLHVFRRESGSWVAQTKLIASDGLAADRFGAALSVSDDTVLVGAPSVDANSSYSGAVYVFDRTTSENWVERAKLWASDGSQSANFGQAVSLSGDTAVIGARKHDHDPEDTERGSGAAYVFFRQSPDNWVEQARLMPSDGTEDDEFGQSVALAGDTIIIGAIGDDDNRTDSGSAYVFTREASVKWVEQTKLLADDGAREDRFGWAVTMAGDTAFITAYADDGLGASTGAAYVFTGLSSTLEDRDNDGVPDSADNCPDIANADQANNDGDVEGDICDADDDNDGVEDLQPDNCPWVENLDQRDTDGDDTGDVCDMDMDGDTIKNEDDNCVLTSNPNQENADGDSFGDACDDTPYKSIDVKSATFLKGVIIDKDTLFIRATFDANTPADDDVIELFVDGEFVFSQAWGDFLLGELIERGLSVTLRFRRLTVFGRDKASITIIARKDLDGVDRADGLSIKLRVGDEVFEDTFTRRIY